MKKICTTFSKADTFKRLKRTNQSYRAFKGIESRGLGRVDKDEGILPSVMVISLSFLSLSGNSSKTKFHLRNIYYGT